MFDNKEITIEKVKDLLYNVENEFNNELDYDYETSSGRELTDDDLDIMTEYLSRFLDKVYAVIDDELEDKESISDYIGDTLCKLEGEEYDKIKDNNESFENVVYKVNNDYEFNEKLRDLAIENIDYYVAREEI